MNINYIRQNPKLVKEGALKKNIVIDVDEILKTDAEYLALLKEVEALRARQNKLGDEVAEASKDEKKKVLNELMKVKKDIKSKEPALEKYHHDLQSLVAKVPNLPLDNVIIGKDDSENKVLRMVGEKTNFDFSFKDYMDIAENLDIIDTKRAAKVSGSRFGYLKGGAALLEIALISYVYDLLLDEEKVGEISKKIFGDDKKYAKAFIPVIPPVMIKPEMMDAMGYVERGGDEIYYISSDNLYLVGTSEQSIGAMRQGEVFEKAELPARYLGFSSCFRREAGSYGKDTKGILRVHQFDKLEMFSFCLPEDSIKEHKLLLAMEEEIMKGLEIPYRVIDICSGDLGDSAAQKYDIEAWIPSEDKYRETHSTSNTTDFQSERLKIKYRDGNGDLKLLHMLNGTAVAVGRIIISIIENYQQADGSVLIPKALTKYTHIKKITPRG